MDQEWISVADRKFRVQNELKRLRKEDSELSAKLKALSGGQTTKRGRYEYKKTSRKGGVDYKAIPELKTVDLEAYRKPPVDIWKLQVVE